MMTYVRCTTCYGKRYVTTQMEDGVTTIRDCPCAGTDAPGFTQTGFTVAELTGWRLLDRVLAGDPGIDPARRKAVLDELERRLGVARERMTKEA